jgi:hypothetical protein
LSKMDGTGDHQAKHNKPQWESQILNFSLICEI